MQRILEPEIMDSPSEAVAYDRMDHTTVNRRFVDDLLAAIETTGWSGEAARVLDLGTGTARVPIELCRRDHRFRVTAIDAAPCMLDVARQHVIAAALQNRIELRLADAKQSATATPQAYQVVISNSLVHHLPDPAGFFEHAFAAVAARGLLFVRDLFRPASRLELDRLVTTYAADAEPAQRKMFADSLSASLTVEEVCELVALHGYARSTVAATSDRHWTFAAVKGVEEG